MLAAVPTTDPVLVLDGQLVVIAASPGWLDPIASGASAPIGRCLIDALPLSADPVREERLRGLLVSLQSALERGHTMALEIRDVSRSHEPPDDAVGDRDLPVLDRHGAVAYVVRVAVFEEGPSRAAAERDRAAPRGVRFPAGRA